MPCSKAALYSPEVIFPLDFAPPSPQLWGNRTFDDLPRSLHGYLRECFYGAVPEASLNSKSPKVGGFRGRKTLKRSRKILLVNGTVL
jgi:hypothetical protein